jgi:hypothetical protein
MVIDSVWVRAARHPRPSARVRRAALARPNSPLEKGELWLIC